MARFRKKPVVVEATQWFPGVYFSGVTEVVHDPGDGTTVSNGYGICTTAHGQQTIVAAGDWVIAEPNGRGYYPCKPDIFEETYEPAPDC
jgi:hypothetical protein